MQRRQAAGKSQPESAAKTAGPEGAELLRWRRQRCFTPSGRPRAGTGRHELDRQSARVRQPDVRRCNRVRHSARLFCELCRDSQDKNNPFRLAEGCRVFKMDTYKEHERAHHPKVEEVRNIKTAVAQAELLETDRMVRVFLLVYWLASEALPMLKSTPLRDSFRCSGSVTLQTMC